MNSAARTQRLNFTPGVFASSPAGDVVVLIGLSKASGDVQVIAFAGGETGDVMEQLTIQSARIWSCQLCPGTQSLILGHFGLCMDGTDHMVTCLDLVTLTVRYQLLPVSVNRSYYASIAMHPDERLAAVCNGSLGSTDSIVTLFDPRSGLVLYTIHNMSSRSSLVACQFSPDGRFLATAGIDHVQVHRVGGEFPLAYVFDGVANEDGPALCLSCEFSAPCSLWAMDAVTQRRSFVVALPMDDHDPHAEPAVFELPTASHPIVTLSPSADGTLALRTCQREVLLVAVPSDPRPDGQCLVVADFPPCSGAVWAAGGRWAVAMHKGAEDEVSISAIAVQPLRVPQLSPPPPFADTRNADLSALLTPDGMPTAAAARLNWKQTFRHTRNQSLGHSLHLRS
jgi:hypothetical protein